MQIYKAMSLLVALLVFTTTCPKYLLVEIQDNAEMIKSRGMKINVRSEKSLLIGYVILIEI